MKNPNRRQFLKYLSAGGGALLAGPSFTQAVTVKAAADEILRKRIPSNQQPIAVIGMGTWQTFNVGNDSELRQNRTAILKLFFEMGGEMIDSSPMYGSSQEVIGHSLHTLNYPPQLFSAEKIWTSDRSATREQFAEIANAWQIKKFDLLQVHNLLRWQSHLDVLKEMKENGEVRYIGITTSHGRRHRDLAKIMLSEPLDFVQLTYNMNDREAEKELLPIALEKGIAVIANRPFQGGSLVDRIQRKNPPLPEFAKEINCQNWPQFLLKFVVSHPAITCAIPATTKLQHMQENMGAATGALPNKAQREEMLAYIKSI